MKRNFFLLLLIVLLVSGCDGVPANFTGLDVVAAQAAAENPAAMGGNSAVESLLTNSTQTMTPFQPILDASYQTPTAVNTLTQGADEWITGTRFEARETGKAILFWDAGGSFPEGFKVVWSKESTAPAFPNDIWDYISDGAARSAEVYGNAGESYYFRICKYQQGVCVFYSTVVKYTFPAGEKTATPAPQVSIKLTSIQSGGPGKANIYWEASGDFPKGFKVVWSESTSEPVYPGNSYQYLSNPSTRSTQVEGTPGKKVYFRVCRYDGSRCDVYSNSSAFTFAGSVPTQAGKSISITSITDAGSGKANVNWNAVGSFPKGFKVVWSTSTSSPVYPGNDYVYLSDPAARSAQVTGTAGAKTYFRVCEYLGGSCGTYSNTYEFTFSGTTAAPTADSSSITITSVTAPEPGKAVVNWSASGSFPKGFKVVWSTSNPAPVYPGSDYAYLSDPAARATTLSGSSGQLIYIRVCRYTGGACSVYSNMVSFTFTSAEIPSPEPTAAPTETPVPIPSEVPTEAPTEEPTAGS